MTRDELFERVLQRYDADNRNLIYFITMGMGKTRCALAIAQKEKRVLIALHSKNNRDSNWPNEAKIWGYDTAHIEFVLHTGLEKVVFNDYDLVVMDECHLITEDIENKLQQIKAHCHPRFVFMTGTMPDDKEKVKRLHQFANNIFEYNFMQALSDGNISNIEINVVEIEMDNTKKFEYAKGRFRTEQEQYFQICRNIQHASNPKLKDMYINSRMWFIYKSFSKKRAIIYLHERMKELKLRHIVFVTTQEFANSISPWVYHGNTKSTMFDKFCAQEIDHLVTVKSLKTGANIPNLRYGITMQIDGKHHNLDQLLARLTRVEDGKHIAKLYVLILKNTMDESWFAKCTANIPSKYFKRIVLKSESLNHIKWHTESES